MTISIMGLTAITALNAACIPVAILVTVCHVLMAPVHNAHAPTIPVTAAANGPSHSWLRCTQSPNDSNAGITLFCTTSHINIKASPDRSNTVPLRASRRDDKVPPTDSDNSSEDPANPVMASPADPRPSRKPGILDLSRSSRGVPNNATAASACLAGSGTSRSPCTTSSKAPLASSPPANSLFCTSEPARPMASNASTAPVSPRSDALIPNSLMASPTLSISILPFWAALTTRPNASCPLNPMD